MSSNLPHVLIRASAGTGKTYQLTNRYLSLLCEGVPPQHILATTFTRKAAGEIFDRVLTRLALAATSDLERTQLAKALNQKSLGKKRCLTLLSATIRRMHLLRIGTLDSFFAQIAGSFALELGLPLGWRIAEPLDDALLRQEAVDAVLSRGKSQDLAALFHLLTKGEVNRSVVNLVLGAASEMYDLCRETEPAAWKLVPRHSPLAAGELADAITALERAEIPAGKQWENARQGDVEAAKRGDWKAFLCKGLANKILCREETYSRKPIPQHLIPLYQRLIDHARGILIGMLAQQTEATCELLTKFASEYERLKDQRRLLRFDDITWRLARQMDGLLIDRLSFRLGAGISHVLLDEFQDTSLAQWQVLRPLAEQVTSDDSDGRKSFFCVGDVKQAIYGWRGGLAEIFDALDGSLCGLTRRELATSFRSSPPVIETVNQVFTQLTQHGNLDGLEASIRKWQDAFPIHQTAKAELEGHVRLQVSPEPAADDDPEDVHYQFAAEEVARLAAEAPHRSLGVLVRTNQAVARMIYLLNRRDVPASEEGGNPLIDSPAVELILSLLAIADHPGDTVARFHLAHSPLGKLVACDDHADPIQAARLSRQLRRQLIEQGYGPTVLHYASLLAPQCDERDRSRLSQLVELAYQHQKSSTLRTDSFRALVASQPVADPSSASIRVMTVHQAKGLEFDIVVLPELHGRLTGQPKSFVAGRAEVAAAVNIVCRYCDENVRELLPPRIRNLFDQAIHQAVTESLCLLYVALTRAVHALHLIIRPSLNERSMPKTYAGLLRAALAGNSAPCGGVVLYEHGNPCWHQASDAVEPTSTTLVAEQPPQVRLAAPAAVRHRNLERTSPSSLEGGQRISLRRVLEPTNTAGFDFGTLIHAWLEQVTWLDDHEPEEATLRQVAARLACEIGPLSESLDAPLQSFRRLLQTEEVRRALCRSYYGSLVQAEAATGAGKGGRKGQVELQVLPEHPFAVKDGEALLTGSIDRLILIRSNGEVVAADVVDYKTDAISAGDAAALSDKVEFYRPQIEAYRRAVQKLFQLPAERVTSRLVFVSAGRVVALQ